MRGAEAVQRVADQAVENMNLPRNASKGGWGGLSLRQLFLKLLVECWELAGAITRIRRTRRRLVQLQKFRGRWGGGVETLAAISQATEDLEKARQHAKHEAGDVVAFAAMIFDRI